MIRAFFEAGIIQNWIEPYYAIRHSKSNQKPEILTVNDLKIGFLFYLFFLSIAILFFSVEIFVQHVPRRKPRVSHKKATRVNPRVRLETLQICQDLAAATLQANASQSKLQFIIKHK
jgi:hypothetical protein